MKAVLSLLKAAAPSHYQYYHLLSGADLCLKTQDEVHAFFDNVAGKEFVHFDTDPMEEKHLDRIAYYWPLRNWVGRPQGYYWRGLNKRATLEKWLQLSQKRLGIRRNKGIRFQKGANWFSITDNLAQYVVQQEAWVRKVFRFGYCVDEMFLQTLVINSEFEESLYISEKNDDYHAVMRYIDWNRGAPYTFRSEDYDDLVNSDYLFARKFSDKLDVAIVRMIKAKVLGE